MNNKDEINKNCPCTYNSCVRHGNCKACKEYHHSSGEKTTCEKMKK